MNIKHHAFLAIGLSTILFGCGGPPAVTESNCSGRGLESALTSFRGDEAARQDFLDKCEALKASKVN